MTPRPLLSDRSIDVHTWFGLSYSPYLVVNRSVLQSMPEDWQYRFTALMGEMWDAFDHLDWPVYEVRAMRREQELLHPPCEECEGTGEIEEDGKTGVECPSCAGHGTSDDLRYETPEEVGFREDPIPHYNRGRTRLTPAPGNQRS